MIEESFLLSLGSSFFFWHPTPCDWLHRKVLVENIVCFHIHYFFSLSRNNPYSYVRSPICYSHHSFQRHFYIWGLRELVSMMWFWIRLRTYFVPQSWPWVFLSFRTHESIFITLPFSSRWTVEIILMPKSSFKWIICDNNKFIFSFFFHVTVLAYLVCSTRYQWNDVMRLSVVFEWMEALNYPCSDLLPVVAYSAHARQLRVHFLQMYASNFTNKHMALELDMHVTQLTHQSSRRIIRLLKSGHECSN